jgi:hypothetical protein
VTRHRRRARDGKPDHPCPDHQNLHLDPNSPKPDGPPIPAGGNDPMFV